MFTKSPQPSSLPSSSSCDLFLLTCTYEFLMNNAKKRKKLKMYKKNLSKKHSTVPSTQYKT